jgi:hypothetical protein
MQNNVSCKLKNNYFKLRHAPYSNRYATVKDMKIIILYITSFVLLISCSEFNRNDKQKIRKIDNLVDNKMTFINDTISKRWLKKNEYSNFVPDNHDLKQIDSIFENAIENGEFDFLKEPKFENLKKYYRQYVRLSKKLKKQN